MSNQPLNAPGRKKNWILIAFALGIIFVALTVLLTQSSERYPMHLAPGQTFEPNNWNVKVFCDQPVAVSCDAGVAEGVNKGRVDGYVDGYTKILSPMAKACAGQNTLTLDCKNVAKTLNDVFYNSSSVDIQCLVAGECK